MNTSVLHHQQSRIRWLIAAVVAAVVVLAIVLGFLFRQQAVEADRLREAEIESQNRRTAIAAVLSAHQDVETGQRGYLLTGREEFLDSFRRGSNDMNRIFPQLADALADEPDQSRSLRDLAAVSRAKRSFAEQVIGIMRDGDPVRARALIASGRGRELMDRIRATIGTMQARETENLRVAAARIERSIDRQRWGSFAVFAALVALLLVAGFAIWRSLEGRFRALVEVDDVSRRRAAILDSAMDAILIVNPSGSIESMNRSATGMFGYTEDELSRRDVGKLFATKMPVGTAAEMLRDMQLKAGEPGSVRTIIGRRRDGSTFPTDVALTLAELAEGFRYVAVIRDVTERDRMDRIKSEFVSTVSHELRTPLTSIAGSLGLLAAGAAGPLGDKAGRLIEIAKNNAERLVRLINDILDVEKLESGRMPFDNGRIDLKESIEQAISENVSFAEGYNVALEMDADDSPAMAYADKDRLAQVLTNLISNAIKFSPPGQAVTVSLAPGDDLHRITVTDRGPGIPDEFKSRIFQKFAQADSSDSRAKGGTGLGLSIVREIVMRMDGTVDFESEPGRGTKFHVAIPAYRERRAETDRQAGVVLLCGAIPDWVVEAFAASQVRVETADTLPGAKQVIDNTHMLALVIDMSLPYDLPAEIVRHVRATADGAEIPIFAIGGEPEEGGEGSDPALLLDWLHKPGELRLISERIDAVLLARGGALPRVLHIDDDPDILRVVATALEGRAAVVSVDSLARARAAVGEHDFDLVILDLTLRDGHGPELLDSLAVDGRHLPIIVFSAEDADPQNAAMFDAFLTKARTPISKLVETVEVYAAGRAVPR